VAEVRASEAIHGVVLVDPVVHGDQRGLFVETWRQEWLPDVPPMVQSNRADRTAGAVVGLHYHRHQADYWYVVAGSARVVLHDLRVGSPTLGATLELDLGGDDTPTATLADPETGEQAGAEFASRFFGVPPSDVELVSEAYQRDDWAADRTVEPALPGDPAVQLQNVL
jgi:hypothetical protein